jgi:hypothetical protein
MLHLGETLHEVMSEVEVIYHDCSTSFDQVIPHVPGVIAEQTSQIREDPLDLGLTAGHTQQDESHFGNRRERNALTPIWPVDGGLPHPEVSPVLPLRELHYIKRSPPCTTD